MGRLKRALCCVTAGILLSLAPACSGNGEEKIDYTVPEGYLAAYIEEESKRETVIGIGAEIDPFWCQLSVGYKGVNEEGQPYECKLSDWENYVVPRVKEMRLQRIRSMLLPSFFCNSEQDFLDKNYDWDSTAMQSVYLILDMAQEQGIDVLLNLWGCEANTWLYETMSGTWVSIPKEGKEQDYCDLFADIIDYLINEKGYTCIKEVTPMNEPNGLYRDIYGSDLAQYKAYADLCHMLHDTFTERGLRSKVKFNLADDAASAVWVNNILNECSDVADIVNSHIYTFEESTTKYDMINNSRTGLKCYYKAAQEFNIPHMYCEFGTQNFKGDQATLRKTFTEGIQLARMGISMFNVGSRGYSLWILFSQVYGAGLDDCFGLWGFAETGYKIYPAYYAYSLMTRYVPRGAEIYALDVDDDNVYVCAFKSGTDWSYLVVNDGAEEKDVAFVNKMSDIKTMKKYVYAEGNLPTTHQMITEAEQTFEGRVLGDTIPAKSFVVYTSMS